MIATHHIEMNLTQKEVTPRVDAVQDDKYSRNLAFSLYEGARKWIIPDGTTAIVCYQKPDRTRGNYDTLPDGTAAYTINGNILTVALAPQVCTAHGVVQLAVRLINGNAEINTFSVEINVSQTPGLQVSSKSYYQVTGTLASSGWKPNMYLGTDENGNVVAKEATNDSTQNGNCLPAYTDADNGKVLGIVDGAPTWVEATVSGGDSSGSDSGETEPTTHGIVWNLVNVTSSNNVVSVLDGMPLVAVLTPADGYRLGDVTITMGGEVVTDSWNADTATVTIASVTGDVIISCAGVAESTGEVVDTTAVIAQEGVGYNSSGTTKAFPGIGITKTYEFAYDHAAIAEKNWYDAENDYTTLSAALGVICAYTPSVKMLEAGYSQSGLTAGASKVLFFRDDTVAAIVSNSSLTTSTSPSAANLQTPRQNTDMLYATGVSFSVSLLDLEDSYAYWSEPSVGSSTDSPLLPVGVRSGDIIFAGKNTEYYGMANIDGTMAGAKTAELSFDDDVVQDYTVATASILGEETATDTSTVYGISSELAAVIDEVRTAWMIEYGGDYRKIPLIITTDQHGGTNAGIFNMLGKTLSLHDVSKICNLGDTVSAWADADTDHPLLSDAGLESWCESVKAIPFSKRLDVYGNHDTWYGNYADEGNAIGTRYPSSQAHLYQYFRNIYARRTNNNGWFVVKDDAFNVKYVVVSGFEYQGGVTFRISTKQMQFIIDEFSKDDGYDIVVVSHVPLHYVTDSMTFPTGYTSTITEDYRISNINTDELFAARKNKTGGIITDSDGVEHSYDFSGCTTDVLCALHGHTHHDAYNYVGMDGLLSTAFEWFSGDTVHFVLIDRVSRQLNIWKVKGDALTYTNYQVPLDNSNA